MASLSLPRVLQLKKNSIDAEREQFERFQTLAVQKAINANETPVKEKHVRSTIIGTFQDQSAATYWMVAIRQPLQDNRIVAWKFCHVTHKLLREGHPACLDDSQRHITMIENLGKLWVHLREGYGKLVHLYCKLLVCKLQFHARNPRFPGNMQLTSDELDAIAENDVNNYFQLCVELFDYMDDILNLEATVFDSLGNARTNSMHAPGQCRLAALIPCAQDSSQIYDCNVRLLFRLHASLPADTLAGHRERFRQQFKKLSLFYKKASNLQYYRNLLTLPMLPSNPPNFLLQSDFGTYVAPVVSIPEPAPDETDSVAALIDTSDLMSQTSSPEQMEVQMESRAAPSPQPDQLMERDRLIEHLQNELQRMRSEVSQMVQERNTMLVSMREHCTRIETQLQATKCDLEEEKVKSETLSAQTPEITQKLAVVEEKAKVQDEKFQKLKGAYTQLREEHIALIRQKAEVDKMAANLRTAAAEHESSKMSLQQQLNDRIKDVELLQQSASSSEEIEAYKNEISSLRSDLEVSRQNETQINIEHEAASAEFQEKLNVMTREMKELTATLDNTKEEKEETENELTKIKEELVELREKSGKEFRKAVEEKEAALQQVVILTEDHNRFKQKQDQIICDLKDDLEKAQQEINTKSKTSDEDILNRDKQIVDLTEIYENQKSDMEDKIKQQQHEIILLEEKYQIAVDSKQEVLSHLKNIMTETDEKTIALNVELQTLKDDVIRLEEELNEKDAELEIANNELMTMKDEYETIELRNDDNIGLKNEELRDLKEKVTKLSEENKTILTEKGNLIDDMIKQTEAHDNRIRELTLELDNLKDDYIICKKEKDEYALKMSEEITKVTTELENIKTDKDMETNKFTTEIKEKETVFNVKMAEKVFLISQLEKNLEDIRGQYEEQGNNSRKQIEELLQNVADKDDQNKMLEGRLEHSEKERLTAESGLQDLLQQNTSLEESVADLKRQLQEKEQQLEIQSRRVVSCAGGAGAAVTDAALAALERGNAADSARAAADLASAELQRLADIDQVDGNEESIAKASVLAAHGAAQLAAYVTEVTTTSTNVQQSDKLMAECRAMLAATRQCLESAGAGADAGEARRRVLGVADAAAAVAERSAGARSVDDELADMDAAIEEAAARIEEMLTANRASTESGGGTEGGGAVLDACTTLMAAVRALVREARELQRGLGDVRTRTTLYRRNPQWAQGLVSAAKAVVFAAKLLVSSADEAVGVGAGETVEGVEGAGMEGVSAAAHEVAGSTAQLVAASRARAPPDSAALAALTHASRSVAAATGAVVAAVRAAAALHTDREALDTSALTLTATRRLEMESKVRSLQLETELDAERRRLAALRKRHYHLAQIEENGNMTNGKE